MRENHILPFLWMRGEPEDVLRRELQKIDEAGIHAVCLEARPHPEFAGKKWWHDLDIVIEEAQKRQMQIWILDDAHFPTGIANGAMSRHPERCRRFLYTQFVDVTGPVPAAQLDVNLLMTKQITWMDLGKPEVKPLLEETRLLSVTASKLCDGDLIEGATLDLTDCVKDGYLTADLPAGVWRINVNYTTTVGPKPEYINYIDADSVRVLIDEVYETHYSRYADLFGTTIAGFFSDEPGFYNLVTYDENDYIGLHMPLPWSAELEENLTASFGESFRRELPLLFAAEADAAHVRIRSLYMEAVSGLYRKNFSVQLGDWCRAHGVSYIGHIVEDNCGHMRLGAGCGHYFRAMAGQDMAGIDNIGYQLMPGNDVGSRHTGFQDLYPEFYHYELGKLAGSDAAIDPAKKGRALCENFGAYGWRLGVRDMKWLTDYLINQGINYFVPHAFSMAEYPDVDCPPHFYAGGNNPQFPYFCELMGYMDRLCNLFSGGKNVPQAAVLYEAEADWAGETMRASAVGKELLTHQIDFELVPSDVFEEDAYYGCSVTDGKLVINGRKMNVLIIPACRYLTARAARFMAAHPQLPVIFLNHYPNRLVGDCPDSEDLLKKVKEQSRCIPIGDLAGLLLKEGIHDAVRPDEADANLRMYHYMKDGRDLYHLMNASLSETVDVYLRVPGTTYGFYDAMHSTMETAQVCGGRIHLILPPYGAAILVGAQDAHEEAATDPAENLNPAKAEVPTDNVLTEVVPLKQFDLELREIGTGEPRWLKAFSLQPISSVDLDFAGTMTYRTSFLLDTLPDRAVFYAEHVYECMTVTLNGKKLVAVLTPPYTADLTEALQCGSNELEVSVATTPLRNANLHPGIFGKERTILEPTGMFGSVEIRLYEEQPAQAAKEKV
jgi:hypothetical protein